MPKGRSTWCRSSGTMTGTATPWIPAPTGTRSSSYTPPSSPSPGTAFSLKTSPAPDCFTATPPAAGRSRFWISPRGCPKRRSRTTPWWRWRGCRTFTDKSENFAKTPPPERFTGCYSRIRSCFTTRKATGRRNMSLPFPTGMNRGNILWWKAPGSSLPR